MKAHKSPAPILQKSLGRTGLHSSNIEGRRLGSWQLEECSAITVQLRMSLNSQNISASVCCRQHLQRWHCTQKCVVAVHLLPYELNLLIDNTGTVLLLLMFYYRNRFIIYALMN
jgi:hypothetical protein